MLDMQRLEELGIQVAEDGQYFRYRVRSVNQEYDGRDPQAVAKGLLVAYDEELIPNAVILPLATDAASLEEARRKAVAAGADFYHPQYGWLRGGIKRERDLPENMGGDTRIHSTRRVVRMTDGVVTEHHARSSDRRGLAPASAASTPDPAPAAAPKGR